MAVIDLSKEALGTSARIRRRRLAVLRYLLRGYTYSEAWEELRKASWWEGWSAQIVSNDMKHLRKFIKDYGDRLPGFQEAVAWALSYYEDTIKEYDRLARQYEEMEKYELAQRYRGMRDSLAMKAFNALGVNSFNISVSPGAAGGGNWEALRVFFGIDAQNAADKRAGNGKKKGTKAKKKRSSKGKNKG